MGATVLKYALVADDGTFCDFHTLPSAAAQGPEEVAYQLAKAIEALRTMARRRGLAACAVGIGCPGTVDPLTKTLTGALPNAPALRGLPIVHMLEEYAGLPGAGDNDANVMALAEASVGAGRGFDSVLGVTVGTGIGGGIVIGGEIFRGRGAAGEIGHMRIAFPGMPCPCGGSGCFEQYAAGPALARLYADHTGEFLHAGAILQHWRRGDHAAREVVEEWALWLARGLACALVCLHPECLVVGGGVMAEATTLLPRLRDMIRGCSLDLVAETVMVRSARLGAAAGVVGAGLLALRSCRGSSDPGP